MGQSESEELLKSIAEKYGVNTHAASIGTIVGRIEHIREDLSDNDEEVFKELANDLGFSKVIE